MFTKSESHGRQLFHVLMVSGGQNSWGFNPAWTRHWSLHAAFPSSGKWSLLCRLQSKPAEHEEGLLDTQYVHRSASGTFRLLFTRGLSRWSHWEHQTSWAWKPAESYLSKCTNEQTALMAACCHETTGKQKSVPLGNVNPGTNEGARRETDRGKTQLRRAWAFKLKAWATEEEGLREVGRGDGAAWAWRESLKSAARRRAASAFLVRGPQGTRQKQRRVQPEGHQRLMSRIIWFQLNKARLHRHSEVRDWPIDLSLSISCLRLVLGREILAGGSKYRGMERPVEGCWGIIDKIGLVRALPMSRSLNRQNECQWRGWHKPTHSGIPFDESYLIHPSTHPSAYLSLRREAKWFGGEGSLG